MPSEKLSDQSSGASGQPEENSVYDFLYYDQTRIASFLAQFDPSGHLTEITNNERAHRSRKNNSTMKATGSAVVLKAEGSDSTETTAEYGKQISKSYDPRWANALAFLDYLDQRELLRRDVYDARIGEIALISGDLSLFDLGLVQKMWSLPMVKKVMLSGANQPAEIDMTTNRHDRRKQAKTKAAAPRNDEAEMALELLSVLPHAIQSAVSNDDISVWASLREDSITINATDLFMKHGLSVDGTWTMVGILDAQPDFEGALDDGTPLSVAKQIVAGSKLGLLGVMLAPHLVGPVRGLLGRPSTSYGFTPLLVFREVSGEVR